MSNDSSYLRNIVYDGTWLVDDGIVKLPLKVLAQGAGSDKARQRCIALQRFRGPFFRKLQTRTASTRNAEWYWNLTIGAESKVSQQMPCRPYNAALHVSNVLTTSVYSSFKSQLLNMPGELARTFRRVSAILPAISAVNADVARGVACCPWFANAEEPGGGQPGMGADS